MHFAKRTTVALDAPNATNGFGNINKTIVVSLVSCAMAWVSATDVTAKRFCFHAVSGTTVSSVRDPVNVVYAVVVAIVSCLWCAGNSSS